MQKPSIGRIVHFTDSDLNIKPAIITAVHNDTMINVVLFGAYSNDASVNKTSVLYGTELEIGKWHWPPRVES